LDTPLEKLISREVKNVAQGFYLILSEKVNIVPIPVFDDQMYDVICE